MKIPCRNRYLLYVTQANIAYKWIKSIITNQRRTCPHTNAHVHVPTNTPHIICGTERILVSISFFRKIKWLYEGHISYFNFFRFLKLWYVMFWVVPTQSLHLWTSLLLLKMPPWEVGKIHEATLRRYKISKKSPILLISIGRIYIFFDVMYP